MSGDNILPLPDREYEPLKPYWDAVDRGEFRLPQCKSCAQFNWYPEPRCRHCGEPDMSWKRLSGRGTIYSFTVVRRALHPAFAPLVPYAAGLVALEEDPRVRMVTRFITADPAALAIGLPVRTRFVDFGYPAMETGLIGPFWEIDQ